jgi:hypothetical protein
MLELVQHTELLSVELTLRMEVVAHLLYAAMDFVLVEKRHTLLLAIILDRQFQQHAEQHRNGIGMGVSPGAWRKATKV